MKLCASTLGCPGLTINEIAVLYRDSGITGIEIRGVENETKAENIACFSPAALGEALKMLRENGLSLVSFGTSAAFDNPAKGDAAVQEVRRTLEVCERAGIPMLRVFGNKIGADGLTATQERIINGIERLCGEASGAGVTVLLEVHGDFNTEPTLLPVCCSLGNLRQHRTVLMVQSHRQVFR